MGSTLGDSMFHGYWWRAAHRYGPFDAVLPRRRTDGLLPAPPAAQPVSRPT
ncbi:MULTISPECIES: hypothetical protein [unclassified Streptomyces]|uniref:hypothetical protein n=1 Tax=unclassified Streptomyces TaxID=2593676 RepID=UPI00131AA029|nr:MULTISPECIES: hypothetical protein [unclassified Streptomyces]